MTTDTETTLDAELQQFEADRLAKQDEFCDRYEILVGCKARGEDYDLDELREVLLGLRKTTTDFAADVKVKQGRFEQRKVIDRTPAAIAELTAAEEEVHRLAAERAAVLSKLDARLALACQQRDCVAQGTSGHGLAAQRLRETAPQRLKDRVAELRRQLAGTAEVTNALRDHVRDLEANVTTSERTLDLVKAGRIPKRPETVSQHKRQLEVCGSRLAEAKARYAERLAASDKIACEIAELEERMLIP